MPKFTCTSCGELTYFPAGDEDMHKRRGYRCGDCWTVIHAKRYNAPPPGGKVIFGPAGPGIGDYLYKRLVMDRFRARHPNHTIVEIAKHEDAVIPKGMVFWSDNAGMGCPPPPGAIVYPLANEVAAFAGDGYYPKLWFDPEPIEFLERKNLMRMVVVNFRNIERCQAKNVTDDEADLILRGLYDAYQRGDIDRIILAGNDTIDGDSWLPEFTIDLRGKLTLEQIAWLTSRAMFTVGKDSGILHLAAAAGGYVVGFGYQVSQWVPKAPEGRVIGIMERTAGWQYKLTEAMALTITRRSIMAQPLHKGSKDKYNLAKPVLLEGP